jgi:hypothetical protein
MTTKTPPELPLHAKPGTNFDTIDQPPRDQLHKLYLQATEDDDDAAGVDELDIDDEYTLTSHFYECDKSFTTEQLYQAFRKRLLSELGLKKRKRARP